MALNVEAYTYSGTVSTSEISIRTGGALGAETADGIFQAYVDLNAMAAGDAFEFRCYEKAYTGQTQRLCWKGVFTNAQPHPMWISPAMVLGAGWDMVLIKTAGTDRTIAARISQVS